MIALKLFPYRLVDGWTCAQVTVAFIGYEVKWEEDTETVTCLHTLTQSSTEAQVGSTVRWRSTVRSRSGQAGSTVMSGRVDYQART